MYYKLGLILSRMKTYKYSFLHQFANNVLQLTRYTILVRAQTQHTMHIRYCACYMTLAVIAFVTADRNFTILQTSDGLNNLCALDQPTLSVTVDGISVEPCVPAVILCAAKCISDQDCGSFNYNLNSHACDIYHGTVANYSSSTMCLHYTV